jgi:hypothetical protein
LTRGDRRRNRRIGFVREVVRPELAILAIDLGEDRQVAVVMDHDRTVLARRVANVKRTSWAVCWIGGRSRPTGTGSVALRSGVSRLDTGGVR